MEIKHQLAHQESLYTHDNSEEFISVMIILQNSAYSATLCYDYHAAGCYFILQRFVVLVMQHFIIIIQ